MAKPLLVGLVALVIGCGQNPPISQPEPPRVWHPDVGTLFRSYQDESDRYTGQMVEVHLKSESYLVSGREIHWYKFESIGHPEVVFVCLKPPRSNKESVILVGRCVGRQVRDDRSWYVRVADCVDQSR